MAEKLPRKPKNADAPAPIGDNSDAMEEGARVQFISIMNKLEAAEAEIETASAVLKAKRNVRKQVIGLAKAAGVPEWQLKARQEEMARPTFENAQNMEAENKQRRWMGIITPEQAKMHLDGSTPVEVREEADWEAAGYRAGVLNRPATLPEGMDARFTQVFMRGHEAGRNSYMLTLAENAPKPKGVTAQQIAEQAARDFKADNPEVDIDKAAKALKNSDFMKTGAPEAEDGFEATPEELAAQKPRQAEVERREAAEEEPAL